MQAAGAGGAGAAGGAMYGVLIDRSYIQHVLSCCYHMRRPPSLEGRGHYRQRLSGRKAVLMKCVVISMRHFGRYRRRTSPTTHCREAPHGALSPSSHASTSCSLGPPA